MMSVGATAPGVPNFPEAPNPAPRSGSTGIPAGNLFSRCAFAPVFRSVAIALDLEFFMAVDRGIDKDRALRADVVVSGAIHRPLIPDRRRPAEGNVHAREQSLVLTIKAFANGCARHQRRQLHEVSAVDR